MRGWLLLLLLLAGCGGAPRAADRPVTTRQFLARYAELQLTRATKNAFLRDELFRIEGEEGLPLQLAAVSPAEPAQKALSAIVAAPQLSYLDRRLALLFPQGKFQIAQRHLPEIERLKSDYSALREELARLAKAPPTIDLHFDEGTLFTAPFLPCIDAALRLELLCAGADLHADAWPQVVKSFRCAWSGIAFLAAQPHLESRVLAAQRRADALRLLEAMLEAPQCQESDVRDFLSLLNQTLADWPSDDRIWRGERARALHFFEMIRDGQVLSLANEELQLAIDDHGGSVDFGRWLYKHVDEDQFFYLETMRRLIDACRSPFFERAPLLEELQSELRRLARSDRDPLLSRVMLLGDIEPAMQWQASDRMHCEVMQIALQRSLGEGEATQQSRRSPLTGRAYRVAALQRQIRVEGDTEQGELGFAVSAPRYDLDLARAKPETPRTSRRPEPSRKP